LLYTWYVLPILSIIVSVTFAASFAENEQVVIPLGASDPTTPFSLAPSVLDIQVNDTVRWQNDDTAIHTITTGTPHLGFDGRIDSGLLSPGETFSYKFGKSGVYEYYCLFHPWMTGLVNVGESKSTHPVIGISISADKTSYNYGDVISISGQVSRFVPNEQVTVWITDPDGRGIAINHIETENSNIFSTNFNASGELWTPGDIYKVYAQYGSRSSVAYTTIELGSNSTGTVKLNQTVQTSSNILPSIPGRLLESSQAAGALPNSQSVPEFNQITPIMFVVSIISAVILSLRKSSFP